MATERHETPGERGLQAREDRIWMNDFQNLGGGERIRTADFYVANVALCQLSYTPDGRPRIVATPTLEDMVLAGDQYVLQT